MPWCLKPTLADGRMDGWMDGLTDGRQTKPDDISTAELKALSCAKIDTQSVRMAKISDQG